MVLTYSGKSKYGAEAIADESLDITLNRGSRGDINWGRARANTSLNPDISNATNKRVMRELFAENSVPMPGLYLPSPNAPKGAMVNGDTGEYTIPEFPIVGRPDHHMKGRGFWKCNSYMDVRRALRGTRRKAAATHFMEYIDAPREYRVHIFKGRSIRISQKYFEESSDRAIYCTIKPQHNIKHVRKAAKKAVEAVGLDFGAVDILADDDRCWVLEVNAAPGLGGSMPRLYAETFKQYLEGDF